MQKPPFIPHSILVFHLSSSHLLLFRLWSPSHSETGLEIFLIRVESWQRCACLASSGGSCVCKLLILQRCPMAIEAKIQLPKLAVLPGGDLLDTSTSASVSVLLSGRIQGKQSPVVLSDLRCKSPFIASFVPTGVRNGGQ